MKKCLCLFVVIISLISSVAVADEFLLHSGVTFGMSAEDIIAKQGERGNSFSMKNNRLTNDNTIRILDLGAKIYYDFDENGRMTRQQFRFRDVNFAPLAREFEKVYGAPDYSSTLGTKLVLPTASFTGPLPTGEEFMDTYYSNISSSSVSVRGNRGEMVTYQWMVETDGGYVVIDLYGHSYYVKIGSNSNTLMGTICLVDYRFFTTEEIDNAQSANAQKYNDI